jgi:predicted acetyltransferase
MLETTVPGGARLPTAGISAVGVLPTHTRRGALRALMTTQLRAERDAGMVLASLRASEAVIYGRFGYGLAGLSADYEIDRRSAHFHPAGAELAATGRLRLLRPEEALELVPVCYERAARWRTGAINRIEAWWRRLFGRFGEPSDNSARWIVLHTDTDGNPDGYVDYERSATGPDLEVRDLFAANDAAYAALWHHLLDVDLAPTIRATRRPLDEALRWLLADARALQVSRVLDEQWARLLDVGAALAARTYAPVPDTVVLRIEDPVLPENDGTYRVAAAGATRADDAARPDLRLGVAEAGATYLGGTTFGELVAAGRVAEERAGAAEAADRLFACRPLPWCGTFF